MKYLVIDAALNGTGIRDEYNGGYIEPNTLGLSTVLIEQLKQWLLLYAEEKYKGYTNMDKIKLLDARGKNIATAIKSELTDVKIAYFSDATMQKIIV
jgi:hypothetical protein